MGRAGREFMGRAGQEKAMTDRKKPGVAFWAIAVLSMPALYLLSFGPACWWFAKSKPMFGNIFEEKCAPALYWPIGWLGWKCPGPVRGGIDWYATVGIKSVNTP